jgi:hypothetical protein
MLQLVKCFAFFLEFFSGIFTPQNMKSVLLGKKTAHQVYCSMAVTFMPDIQKLHTSVSHYANMKKEI